MANDSQAGRARSWLLRILLIGLGSLAVGLGVAGIFLPLLPTTPFLLLAAYCYVRSSEPLYLWLIRNRWTGKPIRNYREGKGIPRKTKVFTILLLWGTLLSSGFLMETNAVRVFLILVGVVISIVILRLPTRDA